MNGITTEPLPKEYVGTFLRKLENLRDKLETYKRDPNKDPEIERILNRAIYSTLRDLERSGKSQEAREIMEGNKTNKTIALYQKSSE